MRGRLLVLTLSLAAALPAFAGITGTLMNADGHPVANARVSMYALETADAMRARFVSAKPEREPLTVTQSDAKGRFSFDTPQQPVVEVVFNAAGYAPESVRVERDDELGGIPLVAAESKSGKITAGGKPVAGARVVWSGNTDHFATTDDQGRYSVPDPSKWAVRVIVMHPDYAVLEDVTRRAMGPANSSPDRTLSSGVALKGRVVGEDGKAGAGGVDVTVNGWRVATSAEDGGFAAAHVPSRWELIEAKSGNLAGARAKGSDLNIRLARTTTIFGTLRDVKTQAPIAGASVGVRRDMRQSSPSGSALSDAKGNFSVTGLAPGSYTVLANRPGYSFSPITVSATLGDKTARTILGTQRGRVTGTVLDEEKRAVAGARLSAQNVSRENMFMPNMAGFGQVAMSAPDGTYVVRVDPDSDLQIEGRKKGFPSGRSATLRLTPGERKSGVTITIPGGIMVTGRVTDRNRKPVGGATVAASDARGDGPGGMVRRVMMGAPLMQREDDLVRTANDGTFSIQLKEGTYDLVFKREGFAARTVRSQQVNSGTQALEVTLEPGVEIAGRVTRNGTGVDGVNINLLSEGAPSGSAETGADGSFRIGDLAPGQFIMTANKQDEFIQEFRPVSAPATDVLIEIPPGGRITGRVLDKNTKQPVTQFEAGVSVARGGGGMMFMGPPQTRPFTSEDGTFALENVPPGQTNLVVSAAGYTAARVPSINIEEGKTLADVEVLMDHGVRVRGKVTGPDGAPVAGASVRLDFMAGGPARMMRAPMNNQSTVTDSNGEYTLEAMEPGEKTFQFSRAGYTTLSKSAELSGAETRLDAQLSSGTRVGGVVVTEGGAPVADANVSAQSAAEGAGYRSTRTDANGAFQLEGLAPGRYTFSASKTGYANGINRDVDVSTAGSLRIVLQTGGTIYGRVIGLSPDEITMATVTATSPNGSSSSPVDAGGNYRIEGAPTGTVRLRAGLSGMITTGKNSSIASVQVEPGGTVQQDIEFNTSTVIRGRVARDGKPVANAMVMFGPRSGGATQTNARTQTDNGGNFEVSGLDDGAYNVSVADLSRGGTPYTTSYDVRGSGTFNIDIKSSSLRGRVVDDATGEPIAEAAVDLREKDTGGGMRFALRTIQTDNAGNFLIDPVPPGSYIVSAEKEGYGTKLREITVGDSPGDVELKLARQAGVTLRVVDARDGRIISAFVRVTDMQNRSVYDSPFRGGSGGGEPMKLPLDAGTYRATISAQGYATQNVTLMSPSSPTIGMTPGGGIMVRSKGNNLRRARLMGSDGREYSRGFTSVFNIDPSPGVTQLDNIAPGRYTLQILGSGEDVLAATVVTVVEGQKATVDI